MKIKWWKILGILLMAYVIIAGTLIPLKPGIYQVYPTKVVPYETTTLDIQGYNTHYDQATTKAWLKLSSDKLIPTTALTVTSPNQLKAQFLVTQDFASLNKKDANLTLIVENQEDGYSLYPGGIRLAKAPQAIASNQVMATEPLNVIHEADDFKFPFRPILHETIRNTFFHVAIWMAMFTILLVSCFHSGKYLLRQNLDSDNKSNSLTMVGLAFGIAGLLTGSFWARFTWGSFWVNDIKLNMSAIAMMIYFAYALLRSSISDVDTRARVSSVYNLFAFVCLMVLVMVIPRFTETDSLHPGNGGNPAFGGEDLDNTLRTIFYPAIIAYTIFGFWMAELYYRHVRLQDRWMDMDRINA